MNTSNETVTSGFDHDVKWEPVWGGGLAGFRATRLSDGAVTYVYLNPSTSGEGAADVFLYSGPNLDPSDDRPVCFVCPEFEEQPR